VVMWPMCDTVQQTSTSQVSELKVHINNYLSAGNSQLTGLLQSWPQMRLESGNMEVPYKFTKNVPVMHQRMS